MKKYFCLILVLIQISAQSQSVAPDILQKQWKAKWIAVPGTDPHHYGVYLFRKSLKLSQKPHSFIVHVSADNRYKLYVNGKMVGLGPARGEVYHWNFETIDIAAALNEGDNTISAQVWNTGEYGNEAQISFRTAFIVQGNGDNEQVTNTDSSWKCTRDSSYSPNPPLLIYTYYAAGPAERKDMNLAPGSWTNNNYSPSGWLPAQELFRGLPKGVFSWTDGWMLQPRKMPAMELRPQRLATVRKSSGITPPPGFPAQMEKLVIPAGKKIVILLDQGYLTNGYPYLKFSGGKNAIIHMGYAEALYIIDDDKKNWRTQNRKGNRNDVENKRFSGVTDEIISNGMADQEYSPMWWRTWRYLQLEVTTASDSLVISDLSGIFTGFPFELKSKFDAGDAELNKILETGWRTARLCAVETYMDCPYYEQLQYVGDTRIQALVSLFNSGDDRLMKNAIELLDQSRMAEGITLSRYPTAHAQEIPPFSLWWIAMLHDYWIYRDDLDFVKSMLPGMRQVLIFFQQYQDIDGSLKNVPYWNFTDWVDDKGWNSGVAPIGTDGYSAAMDFQLLNAFMLAAELENSVGMPAFAAQYNAAAKQLKETITKKYWSDSKKLFADISAKNVFSQHANALAILTGTVTGNDQLSLAEKMLADTSISQATVYFKYYINRAAVKAGLGDRYLGLLGDWRKQLTYGLTTWAEISNVDVARSDCHAWGSSPNIELYRSVLGIDSDGQGFKKIRIAPHPGNLTKLNGSIPHPKGEIAVAYEISASKIKADITIPNGSSGVFIWKGKSYSLKQGKNTFNL